MSQPRGNAKSFLVARIAALFLDPLFKLGDGVNEVVVVSGSMEQSRIVFGFIRESIEHEKSKYRVCDSAQRLWIEHKATGSRVRAISSSAKRAMGLATFNLIIGDEPASWESRDGRLMFDAIRQAIGKRAGQRLLLIGTLAPSEVGSWWPELIKAGSNKATGVFVTNISADIEEPWDEWETVKACNPMMRLNKTLRNTVKMEWEEAKANPYFKPSFEAFRLNRLVETREEMLCQGGGLASGRRPSSSSKRRKAHSRAWILDHIVRGLQYGRYGRTVEVRMLCPMRRDTGRFRETRKSRIQYQRVYIRSYETRGNVLLIDEGLRVARPQTLLDKMILLGIEPEVIYC